ncbi:MAG TPA: hypothetical protein PL005_16400 [Candidatus Hydrogenedentes bacterium]|nr:hypothetical protein [Candidatus Hydrogenedentota bacterium]HQL96256.1 hypothetical protein [Candidatus Hydrogenedentota bacterium]
MRFTPLWFILSARGYYFVCVFLPLISYVLSLGLLNSDVYSIPFRVSFLLLVPALFLPVMLMSIEWRLGVLRTLPYSKRNLSAALLLALSGIPAAVAALAGLFSAAVLALIVGRTDLRTSWFFLSAAGPCVFLFGSIPFSRLVVLELLRRTFPRTRLSVHQILLVQTLLAVIVCLALLALVPQRSIPGVMLVAGALFFPLLSLRPDAYAYKLRPMDTTQKPDGAKVSRLPKVFRKPVWSSNAMWFFFMVTAFFVAHSLPHGVIRAEIVTLVPFIISLMLAGILSEYAAFFLLSPRAHRQLPVKRSTQAFRLAFSLLATPIPVIVYLIAVTHPGVSAFLGEHALEMPSVFKEIQGRHAVPSPSFFSLPAIALMFMFPFAAVRISPSRSARALGIFPLVFYAISLNLPARLTAVGIGGPAGSSVLFIAFLLAWFLFWRMLGNSLIYRRPPWSAVK